MDAKITAAVRQVLKEASQHEHFFDFSDAERLNWMIARAYELGRSATTSQTDSKKENQEHTAWWSKRQTSR
jgi:hypothetical protein